MNENNNIEQSFLDTIKNENLKDIASDYSELALDSFLSDGLLKDIPFLVHYIKDSKGSLALEMHYLLIKYISF